jgi:DNA-binding CsgD family transcriptional regulator
VGDLFGFLFLFLIEKETVEDATEENRFSTCNAIVNHQQHAFGCFQSMGLRLKSVPTSDRAIRPVLLPEELAKAIRKIVAGGRYVSLAMAENLVLRVKKDLTCMPHETLSDREYEVTSYIASGKTVTEIAEELSLSAKTISTYRARVLEKLGVLRTVRKSSSTPSETAW